MIGGPAPGGRTAVLVGYGPKTTVAARRPRKTTAPAAPAPGASESRGTLQTLFAEQGAPIAEPAGVRAAGAVALAKPPVRKLARDLGVDLTTISRDRTAGLDHPRGRATRPPATAWRLRRPRPTSAPDREQRIPVKGVRKLTAENMVATAFTAPHVTEFLTVDVTRGMKALDRLRELPDWRDVRVSPAAPGGQGGPGRRSPATR